MTDVRKVLRVLGGAGLLLSFGVATNQVLNNGTLSWTWMYAAFGFGVLSLLLSERAVPAATEATPHGGRRVYLRQLRASVRDMETVGIATQSEFVFRMRQVYVDVSVVPQPLHNATREPYLGSVSGGERRSLKSVLRDADRDAASRVLAVIGGPGSGKTTLARNTALGLCEHRWRPWRRRLPVLLYLRDHATALLADEPPTLGTVAVSAGWLEGKVPARWLDRRLDRGGCVVLLDGLDEVADRADRDRVVAWVARQIQRHPDNVYVVTSRPHGYETNPLPGAEVLQVRRFTWRQIELFLRQWAFATESRARQGTEREIRAIANRNATDLLTRLRGQPALYELAANPLLLTMTANVHRYRGQLPGSRAELYAEMCDVLLHRRAEARGLSDATGLGGPHKRHVAQHLALAMMRARVRDWPVRDAATAIRRPLRQVPGTVTAEVFLTEARKSGLLVEREHGVYGFAHLTLQEYLAAAQLGDSRTDSTVLTTHVDDPWWRETILLWSASNDATPVINACLDRNTVPALALALDCVDQARTVDPEVRESVDDITTARIDDMADAARMRLFIGVLAARILRETIQLDDTTALCARPVPRLVYWQFVREEREAGRHHDDLVDTDGPEAANRAMVGMRAGDAERFVAWLNAVTGDAGYRLPTPEELHDPAAATSVDLAHHTLWARHAERTVLHRPDGAPWPYSAPSAWLRTRPVADRLRLMPFLRLLALPAEDRNHIEGWTRVLLTGITHVEEIPGSPHLAPLELPLTLALALALDDARAHLSTRDGPAPGPGRPGPEADKPFTRARRLIDAVTPALIVDPSLDFELNRAIDFAPDSGRALTIALNQAYERTLARARELDPDLTHDSSGHYTLHFDLRVAVEAALPLAVTLDGALDLELNDAPALDRVFSDVDDPLDIGLALDLVFSLDDNATTGGLPIAAAAFHALSTAWTYLPGPGADLASFDDFMTRVATDAPAGLSPRPPEDPATDLRDLSARLRATQHTSPRDPRALSMLDETVALLTSMRDRRSPSDDRSLACARSALLATLAILRREDRADEEAVQALRLAWQSLTALPHFPTRQPAPNQLLLLARTQP
ncbi:NACHT domain-containing protein [Streptomyces caniscabiei]|uniref:NACHT domain-containing protein n=1 Tax=Streptomyces caniscabiei TaxID=2746961 RepID=UPI000A3B0D46|nr:NACHT domain-containing protein [Streptomyces caniscabiei]